MTCEDCIHNDVCCSYLIADEDFEITNADKMANSCNDFADRSLFIKLPCKVGDTIYRICPVGTGKGCSSCPWEYCECFDIGFRTGFQNSIRKDTASDFAWIVKRIPYFGKIYFTTSEEAEQTLRECGVK